MSVGGATRRVDLMAACTRASLALCADGMTILPPTKRGKKQDQMVVGWFEFRERLKCRGFGTREDFK